MHENRQKLMYMHTNARTCIHPLTHRQMNDKVEKNLCNAFCTLEGLPWIKQNNVLFFYFQ